jgi:hypothetical protein
MSTRDREGLITRIRQIRRIGPLSSPRPGPPASRSEEDQLSRIEDRIAHLEHLVQGLQDSVHRESTRQSDRLAELEAQIQPTALTKALSQDARHRGL